MNKTIFIRVLKTGNVVLTGLLYFVGAAGLFGATLMHDATVAMTYFVIVLCVVGGLIKLLRYLTAALSVNVSDRLISLNVLLLFLLYCPVGYFIIGFFR